MKKETEHSESEPKAGDTLLYVPSLDFWTDSNGAHFDFVHAEDGPATVASGRKRVIGARARAGDPVEGGFGVAPTGNPQAVAAAHDTPLGHVVSVKDGIISTSKGFKLKVAGHKECWEGTVREETKPAPHKPAKAMIDGVETDVLIPQVGETVLVLDVVQPKAGVTHQIPLSSLPHDPSGSTPHSYHTPEEEEAAQ